MAHVKFNDEEEFKGWVSKKCMVPSEFVELEDVVLERRDAKVPEVAIYVVIDDGEHKGVWKLLNPTSVADGMWLRKVEMKE